MDKERDFFGDVLKYALALALAGLLLWGVRMAFINYQVRKMTQVVEDSIQQIGAKAAASQAMLAEQRRARSEAGAAADRRAALERLEAERAELAKERAWWQYFKPSPECLEQASVECGNAYIRARRERMYQAQ